MKKGKKKLLYFLIFAVAILVIMDAIFLYSYFDLSFQSNSVNYNPEANFSAFVSEVNNKYFTLIPGTQYTYESETDEGTEKNIVVVTNKKKEILGVETTVVWDRVWLDNELIEETYDWYAQDEDGNVWYFGEDSKEYENGEVISTEGSWEAGVDGAEQGIIMQANPKVGATYRQEFYENHAEDMAKVIAIEETVTVPYGNFTDCLKVKEWNPLEKDSEEYKYYCPEIGNLVMETSIDSEEKLELINFKT